MVALMVELPSHWPVARPVVEIPATSTLEEFQVAEEVTEFVLHRVFAALYEARVFLEGIVLKPNMVIPGKKSLRQARPEQVAEATLRVLRRSVPTAVPGVAFLSGGQADVEATANLDAINHLGGPWSLTFSYGRALQAEAMKTWAGKRENVMAAQAAFAHRAQMNALAQRGHWTEKQEQLVA